MTAGHLSCRQPPAEGASGRDHDDVSANDGANMHRPSDPKQPRLRELEGAHGYRRSAASDLRRRHLEAAQEALEDFENSALGPQVPDDHAVVATGLGIRHSVLRFPTGGATDHPHHEHDLIRAAFKASHGIYGAPRISWISERPKKCAASTE